MSISKKYLFPFSGIKMRESVRERDTERDRDRNRYRERETET